MKALLALLLAGGVQLPAPQPEGAAPQGQPQEQAPPGFAVAIGADEWQRMTVPVRVDGKGPYRFVVDTGAERTVIARELAQDLRLRPAGAARVHSMTEVSDIATVSIPALVVGSREVSGIKAPALERRNLGAEGMLGVDALKSERVSFDFVRHAMTVVSARKHEESWAAGAIVVTARSRFGYLVLLDASIEGEKVWVVVDTGAQTTVGNTALRRRLEQKHRLGAITPVEMVSVTGGKMMADQTTARIFRIGGVDVERMPIAFADAHPFKKLDLLDRPAILLGMDVLMLFERVSVDFPNRRVRLLIPGRSEEGLVVRAAPVWRNQTF
jgi:predicted aspartyl protease